jgi:hypothetical protein
MKFGHTHIFTWLGHLCADFTSGGTLLCCVAFYREAQDCAVLVTTAEEAKFQQGTVTLSTTHFLITSQEESSTVEFVNWCLAPIGG